MTLSAPASPAAPWRTGARGAALLGGHKPLVALVLAGAALRAVALVAVYPGIWVADSNVYVASAASHTLAVVRVVGYSLVVLPFWALGSAAALIVVQHLLGVALGVLVYALLLRRGVPKLLATLATVPLLLDAYLIHVEHTIMPETVFHAALLGVVALLLWSDERPGLVTAAAAGLLLGYASTTRPVGAPFVAIFVAYLLLRRVGWRRLAVFFVGWLVVVGCYATVFRAQHGHFGFSEFGPRFLYARVAPFADCSRLDDLPADERRFCPDTRHRLTTNDYLWGGPSPIREVPLGANPRLRHFDRRVLADRPLTYAGRVAGAALHYFEPGHRIGHDDSPVSTWQFPADPRHSLPYPAYQGPIRAGAPGGPAATAPTDEVSRIALHPRTRAGAGGFLHGYQRIAYTPGPLLAVCLAVALAAVVTRRGAPRLRLDAALLAALTLAALITAVALAPFSYRYGLVAVVALPPAAALAGAALLAGRARGACTRTE